MLRNLLILTLLAGCGGLSWNTTVADDPVVRRAMLDSIRPGATTESELITRWGRPTQRVIEGGETRFIYRNMKNPPDYPFPQFGDSRNYVVVVFQYGRATTAYSNDTEGCRATFAPRPPGQAFDNPTTVHPVNCGQRPSSPSAPLDATSQQIIADEYGSGRSSSSAQSNSGKL